MMQYSIRIARFHKDLPDVRTSGFPKTNRFGHGLVCASAAANLGTMAAMSARRLKRYWTSARYRRAYLEAMAQREADRPLQGDIRVDDAYLGGERTGGGPGRGSSNKVALLGNLKTALSGTHHAFKFAKRLGYTHKVVLAPRGKAGTEIEPFKSACA
jgi:hypothetical protein